MEIWKDIKGYEGKYQISSYGRVRSLDRMCTRGKNIKGKMLISSNPNSRYDTVNLSNGKSKTFAVHGLMAKTFIDDSYISKGLVVDHINNDKRNNELSNLQLITSRENSSKDRYRLRPEGSEVGVYPRHGKYESLIEQNGKCIYLGVFKSKDKAKEVYNNALDLINKGGDAILLIVRQECKNKYRGVGFHKASKKWRSSYLHNGVNVHVGLFNTEVDAKIALDKYLNK